MITFYVSEPGLQPAPQAAIPGYPSYLADTNGLITGPSGKILRQSIVRSPRGREYFCVKGIKDVNGKHHGMVQVRELVLSAFSKRPASSVAANIDGNLCNNELSNLKWIPKYKTPTTDAEKRFWEKVDKTPGYGPNGKCWIWTAYLDKDGYGQLWFKGVNEGAHRFSWYLHYGKLPTEMMLHHCDNPSCIRPDHLFEGDAKDNADDAKMKGRHGFGEQHPLARLTEKDVRDLRNQFPRNGRRLNPEQVAQQKEIAGKFGITIGGLRRMLYGFSWRHVG